jgi:hypothetical protein
MVRCCFRRSCRTYQVPSHYTTFIPTLSLSNLPPSCKEAANGLDCLRNIDYQVLQDIFNDPQRLWEQNYNYTLGLVEDQYWFDDTAWHVLNGGTNVTVPLVHHHRSFVNTSADRPAGYRVQQRRWNSAFRLHKPWIRLIKSYPDSSK